VIREKYVENDEEEAKNQVTGSAGYLNEQPKFNIDVNLNLKTFSGLKGNSSTLQGKYERM
jgi:uncharacterized protein affecting Mg2+/Co2+ transport